MTDTHTHLYLADFDAEGQPDGSYTGQCAAIDRATEAGIGMMVFPNVDLSTMAPMRAVHALRPEVTRMAMGLHPTEVREDWQQALAATEAELRDRRAEYVAVGEVGIDLYWDKTFEDSQMQVFDRQASLAEELGLPLIIHCREGLQQVLEVLGGHKDAKAVFHSFGGSEADVEAIRRCGDYYFGINGIVTFKNSSLAGVLPSIGASRLLLETDSPYLAPVPHRGKRNESAYIPLICSRVASALGIDPAEAEAVTDTNARNLFTLQQ